MKLLGLHVENFGTLQNFSLAPADGLNVLYQKNGWGKTTLAVFIKAMLYGLPATSKKTLDDNERKKYTPWQGGAFGGSIEFETEKGRFRAERFFGVKESLDTFALYDLDTNLPSTAYTEALGEDLFGIDADGFERSTYLSQRRLSGGRDNNSIAAKLGDLLDDVDDISNFDAAMASLDKRRKFYTLTGGRGAIADTETALARAVGDLEHCHRVEETLRLREEELSALAQEIKAAEEHVARLRRSLQKAGLARERAALTAQKASMEAELTSLTKRRERINDFFKNAPPTEAEVEEGRRAYEAIREAKAYLDAIPAQIDEAEALERLRLRYPNGAPDDRTLERIETDNRELVTLCAGYASLTEKKSADPILLRFPDGAPSPADLNEAKNDLREAAKLGDALNAARVQHHEAKARKGRTLPCLLGLTGGAVSAILAFLPPLASLRPVLLSLGAVLCIASLLGLVLLGKARKKADLEQREAEQRLAEDRAAKLASVRELLEVCGSSCASENDLMQALADLSALCERYRDALRREKEMRAEAERTAERIRMLSARLHAVFSIFFQDLPHKNDYRTEIDAMRRELDLLSHLEKAAKRLEVERQSATSLLRRRQEGLLPFLQRFDPAGKMRAGECLNFVAENLSEYRRLGLELSERRQTLKRFVSEKALDRESEPIDPAAYDRIVAEEKAVGARLAELGQRRERLWGEVLRLSEETDRIPDLDAQIAGYRETLSEYRANAATIANTAKLLEESKHALSTRYLGGMQQSFEKYLAKLTQNQAPDALIDTSFEVQLRAGGQTRRTESFSRGWRDAIDFCMRLALTNALFDAGEKPFLLLDDPLVNLDDDRLPAARALLEDLANEYQILYFVCHKDRI